MSLTDTSRYMSLILRHKPETIGISLDEHGWANVDELISGIAKTHEFDMDIYAMGILLNVMLTGKLPKEEKASGDVWNVIERCISLEPDKRYTADELTEALETIRVSDGE